MPPVLSCMMSRPMMEPGFAPVTAIRRPGGSANGQREIVTKTLKESSNGHAAPSLRAAPNLSQRLVRTLTERLAGGALPAGTKLPTESELMAQYGVSRTVVREALSQLRAGGQVETRHGIGTFVCEPAEGRPAFPVPPIDSDALAESIALLELRISLETEGAALAAVRRTGQQLEAIRRALAAIADGADGPGGSIGADIEFHVAIASATGNHYFADLLRHLGPALIPRGLVDAMPPTRERRADHQRRLIAEHEDIVAAIARGDADGARAAMRTHLAKSRERLRAAHPRAPP